jgi:hypothetical protein
MLLPRRYGTADSGAIAGMGKQVLRRLGNFTGVAEVIAVTVRLLPERVVDLKQEHSGGFHG